MGLLTSGSGRQLASFEGKRAVCTYCCMVMFPLVGALPCVGKNRWPRRGSSWGMAHRVDSDQVGVKRVKLMRCEHYHMWIM